MTALSMAVTLLNCSFSASYVQYPFHQKGCTFGLTAKIREQSPLVLLCQSGTLVTGVNAARRAQDLATVVIPRDSSYLGTLVDDLVTKVAPPNCLAVHGLASAVSDGSAAAA